MERKNALFLSSNVIVFPQKVQLPVARMSDERIEALGELYVRLKIGQRYRLDFDSYVWAVHTGRWYELVENHFPRIHECVTHTVETPSLTWWWFGFSALVLCWIGGITQ